MELRDLISMLRRRWHLSIAVLVLTVAAGFVVVGTVGPTFRVQATVVLLPPESTWEGDESGSSPNPYLYLGGLNQARDLLVRSLVSGNTQERMEAVHPGVAYIAQPDATSSGPVVVLEVEGSTADAAMDGMDLLVESVPTVLAGMQERLSISTRASITSSVLTRESEPTIGRKDQIRSAVMVVAVMLALGAVLIGLVDRLLTQRARARLAVDASAERSLAVHGGPVLPADHAPVPRGSRFASEPRRDRSTGGQ